MKSIIAVSFAGAASVMLISPLFCQEMGDAKRGEELAKTVCAECHAVERDQGRSRNRNAPRFQTLATTPGMTPMAFMIALRTSHKEMPNLALKNGEIDDLIAYFATLK